MNSVKLQRTQAAEVTLVDSKLHDGKLICANFRSATFDNAELDDSDCRNAVFEEASFRGADLRGASFVDADLFDADARDAKADHRTNFGSQTCREFLFDRDGEYRRIQSWTNLPREDYTNRGPDSGIEVDSRDSGTSSREEYMRQLKYRHRIIAAVNRLLSRNPVTNTLGEEDIKKLSRSREIYKDLKQLFRENPVPEQRRHFNIREKETQRKIGYTEASWSWVRWSVLRWSMMYGESAKQVLIAAIGVVLISSLVYPVWGLQFGAGSVIQYSGSGSLSLDYMFSFISYSLQRLFGPTDGTVTPIGLSVWVALAETIAGALLTAMLVFTLGRRATS